MLNTRPYAEIAKILIDTAAVLSTRGVELLTKLIDELPGDEPSPLTIDAGEDTSDATRSTVLLAWDNSGTAGHVTIDWGVTDVVDDDEPATGTKSYKYATAGTYVITVTDLTDAARTAQATVVVPFTA